MLGDSGFEDDFSEFTVPETRTHGFAERALDVGEDGFTHPALVVVVVFHSSVVCLIEVSEFTML